MGQYHSYKAIKSYSGCEINGDYILDTHSNIYQHCSAEHLKRYLAEFDFRYNHREGLEYNDRLRTENLLAGITGKRLTYRRVN